MADYDTVGHHALIGKNEADRRELLSQVFDLAIRELKRKMMRRRIFAAGNKS